VILEAKPGVFTGGRLVADGIAVPVERRPGGWHFIPGPGPEEGGQVRYGGWSSRITAARAEGILEIRFGWSRGTFEHRGRSYVVTFSFFGRVRVEGETGIVASGGSTWGGLRLEWVPSDLGAFVREITFGLALKALADDAVLLAAGTHAGVA